MPDTNSSTVTQTSGGASNINFPEGAGINSPGLTTKSTKPKRRSISDVSHVFQIIGVLEQARRSQNEKNGRIQAKLNSERPYSEEELKSEGLGYKSNFSTKPLGTTAGKVSSRLTKSLQAARYLTSSELPDSIPDAKKKTELFRRSFTNLVRKWDGWYNFCNEVSAEDAIFGWATTAWLDEVSWKPVFFRQDRAFFPDGTKQTVDSAQVWAFNLFMFPHELADFISDREAADLAGWDIENTVESINNARPPSIPAANAAPYTDLRRYEDAMRESSVSLSLVGGAKQIRIWHLFATEIDGKVSHYIGDGDSKKLLFSKLDRFDSVKDCLAFMSYEQSQTLMGSKGIGREIYEIAGVVDRARNEVVDRLQLSGKIIVQGPQNQINKFRLTVIGNVIVIPEGFTITQNKIEASVEEFLALDQALTQLLDQIAGGVTPRKFEGERVTAKEVQLFQDREEEKRDDITTRFVTQAGCGFLSTMQRRAYSPDVQDADAKVEQEKLLKFMSRDELDQLREQPALRTVEDYSQHDAQTMVVLAQESRNDPLYDHKKMERRKLSSLFDAEMADDVLLPDNDPTVQAEQARTQLLEDQLLGLGKPVPVSPRDNHEIHMAVLREEFAPVAQAAGGGDAKALAVAPVWLKHWEDHLDLALQSGINKEALKPMIQEIKDVAKHVGELQAQAQAKAQQAQAAQAQLQASISTGAPAPAAGAAGQSIAAAPSPQLAPAPITPAA